MSSSSLAPDHRPEGAAPWPPPISLLGFTAADCALASVFAASGNPIPMYETYRRADGVTTGDLALTAVAYFAGAMLALLALSRPTGALKITGHHTSCTPG